MPQDRSSNSNERFWMAIGILTARAYYQRHPKRGYRVEVYHDNPEVQQLLVESFGGKVSRGMSGKGVWYLSGEEKVRQFIEMMEPYMTKSQWIHWLVSIGKISKSACSACGAPKGTDHIGECYLAPIAA